MDEFLLGSGKKANNAPLNCTSKFFRDAKRRAVLLLNHSKAAQGGKTGDRLGRRFVYRSLKIREAKRVDAVITSAWVSSVGGN